VATAIRSALFPSVLITFCVAVGPTLSTAPQGCLCPRTGRGLGTQPRLGKVCLVGMALCSAVWFLVALLHLSMPVSTGALAFLPLPLPPLHYPGTSFHLSHSSYITTQNLLTGLEAWLKW
jgi:hypothetical protein